MQASKVRMYVPRALKARAGVNAQSFSALLAPVLEYTSWFPVSAVLAHLDHIYALGLPEAASPSGSSTVQRLHISSFSISSAKGSSIGFTGPT